jgi:hypothetical protein
VSKRPVIDGFVLCTRSLLVRPLGLGGLIIGITALVRGRIGVRATLVVSAPSCVHGRDHPPELLRQALPDPKTVMGPTLEVGDRIVVDPGGGDTEDRGHRRVPPAGGRRG